MIHLTWCSICSKAQAQGKLEFETNAGNEILDVCEPCAKALVEQSNMLLSDITK